MAGELELLLSSLLGNAQQRPDLLAADQNGPAFGSSQYRPAGQQQVATFLGRMVRPEDTLESILSRVPAGEFDGGGNALGAIPTAAMTGAKVLATFHPGGPRYHGTPYVYKNAKISSEGLGGPGYYLTDLAEVAGGKVDDVAAGLRDNYAFGSTFGGKNKLQRGPEGLQQAMEQAVQAQKSWTARAQALLAKGDVAGAKDAQALADEAYAMGSQLGPNVRKYQLKPHETFNMDRFLDPGDIKRMQEAASRGVYATEAGQGLRDLLAGINAGGSSAKGADLMYALGSALMPSTNTSQEAAANAVNKFLRSAGFGSVSMAGGIRQGVHTGGPKHEAMSLLDLSLIEPYYEWLAAQRPGSVGK